MTPSKPIGLKLRASSWTITFVIGLSCERFCGLPFFQLISIFFGFPGIAVDLLVYSIIIPVIPFQLEKLGYSNISALTGWLLFCYASPIYDMLARLVSRYYASRLGSDSVRFC